MVRILSNGGSSAAALIASALARASKAIPSRTALNIAACDVVDLIPTNAAAALGSGCGV